MDLVRWNDWSDHAAIMGSIYQNAYVTITASAARSFKEGYFYRHPVHEIAVRIGGSTSLRVRKKGKKQGFPSTVGWMTEEGEGMLRATIGP